MPLSRLDMMEVARSSWHLGDLKMKLSVFGVGLEVGLERTGVTDDF